ncbi:phosphoribosyltransferase [Pseudomonas sp. R5(2019)]|uniref:phosphoribosyltransferase n=1 Tax=Pseudomonas sp. R5(2019) TaxID=2697566 RepID=UPI00353267CE
MAYEIAMAFKAPLDVILSRKIGAPGHEEFAIGAIVDGPEPIWVVDQIMLDSMGMSPRWFEAEKERQLEEIRRRRAVYCGNRRSPLLAGRDVIVVDDGVATGNTARVVLMSLAGLQIKRLILAVPVGPRESLESLRPLVDELVCPVVPSWFGAVGAHYQHFEQTTDEEVIELLEKARREES